MAAPDTAATDELVGEVTAVVFTNVDNGFGVVEIDGGPRATGPLATLVPGQPVRLLGRWTEHARYGRTFEAVAYELAKPSSVQGLVAFLQSDRFPGVGPTIAERLAARFGLDFGTVVERAPERLAEVRGVSPGLAARIADAWREAGALAELVQTLAAAGISMSAARDVHRHFGDEVRAVLEEDPYRLLAVPGVRWSHAEALARAAGIDPLDERRLAAGAAAALREHRARGGHTAVPTRPLTAEAGRLLGVGAIDAQRAVLAAEATGAIAREDTPTGEREWYLPGDRIAERGLADELARLLAARSRLPRAAGDADLGAELTAEQQAGVRSALTLPVSVLTGGPGTGKTRTVVEVVRACEGVDARVALCAPTGRAAKRLEEVTGRGATTIHRLLEARGVPGAGFAFGYDEHRRLPHDLVVADEWSMADTVLAWALVRAVDDGAHLLLVGDADQLPSVGPGAVLRDLIDVARDDDLPLAAIRLTQVHRQAAESRIVTLAHEVNAGAVAVPRGRMGDVFAVPEHSARIGERVAAIVAERAPAFFACSPADVQVLAPMYRGPAGVDHLNAQLKERLNPARGRAPVAGFHEGDRVVQTRNDADLDVANGDIGQVIAADPKERRLEVAFPHGVVGYDGEAAGDLAPAWCLTVHKSQGGEWPVVVLVLDPAHRVMLWRELVYTAITRAAEGLLLVGDPALLVAAAGRSGSGARERRTGLAWRLRQAVAVGVDGSASAV